MARWPFRVNDYLSEKTELDVFEHGVSSPGSSFQTHVANSSDSIAASLLRVAGPSLTVGLPLTTRAADSPGIPRAAKPFSSSLGRAGPVVSLAPYR